MASSSASSPGVGRIPVPGGDVTTTILVVTSPEHKDGARLRQLTGSPETSASASALPRTRAFDVHVGCSLADFPEDILREDDETKGPVVLVWWFGSTDVLGELLRKPVGRRVTWMHSGSAGVEHLLGNATIRNAASIPLTNAKGAFSASLGEWAIFSFLWFNKRVHDMRMAHEKGEWMRQPVGVLSGKTVSVVGYGDIGRAVAVRAKALGMRVIGLRRDPSKSADDLRARVVDEMKGLSDTEALAECARRSDFVVLALPHTKDTEGMFSKAIIAAMKPSAVVVNVGRGAVVDEDALIEALREKRIRGAALDVTAKEPLPPGHPLYGMSENVLLSFHAADFTDDYYDLTLQVFEQHLRAYAGEPVSRNGDAGLDALHAPAWNLVDKEKGY
jgi:phosphoglycerate dehydrogenase-like enzyme